MENKVIKKVIRKPIDTEKNSNSVQNLFRILNVLTFIMVFVIFSRGFNIKGTVRDENTTTRKEVTEQITKLKNDVENSQQNNNNYLLSQFSMLVGMKESALKEQQLTYQKSFQNGVSVGKDITKKDKKSD